MAKAQKNRASKQPYVSTEQLTLTGFETPFSHSLRSDNRWIILSHQIPWDSLVGIYSTEMNNDRTGAGGINPRVALGALIIKHICNLTDRETVQQIQENMYMQYFIGYSSFSEEEPFDASLFVDIRKRLGIAQLNALNEKIVELSRMKHDVKDDEGPKPSDSGITGTSDVLKEASVEITHKGKLIVDATACPQDIAYPTDLNLLNDARMKSEELIDFLYTPELHGQKPRTYREVARKCYLQTAQKKKKSKKVVRSALRKQLSYLGRNLRSIDKLLNAYSLIPFDAHQYKYMLVIRTLYDQQKQMYESKTHSIEDRIVSIHQPHVRPIVRGKTTADVEFGAKIQVSLMDGYAFLDDISWDAFNEGTRLISSVEKYKARFGYYPKQVAADKIYCNRENRRVLKELGIELRAKALGRPRAVDEKHVSPGERNSIEGKFGQAKTAYGMGRIRARLPQTSESWIAAIILVLNLVKLARVVSYALLTRIMTFSASTIRKLWGDLMRLFQTWLGELYAMNNGMAWRLT
jgi:transposase, IS5 family